MQHRIGRSTQHNRQPHGIDKTLPRHNIPRLQIQLQQMPDRRPRPLALLNLLRESAGVQDEYGSDKPRHSINDDIVLAVYIPPHAPAPGQDLAHNRLPLLLGDRPREFFAITLKRRNNIQLSSLP